MTTLEKNITSDIEVRLYRNYLKHTKLVFYEFFEMKNLIVTGENNDKIIYV